MPYHHFQALERQAKPVDRNMPLLRRKQPRQGRSIALVNALKQACRQILAKEGTEELTAARLAEVSGVATGSIYEYFPSLESLVAEVLNEEIEHAAEESSSALFLPENTSLHELLSHMVHRAFEKRAYLAALHGHVYIRYMQYFEAIEVDTIEHMLAPYSEQITLRDKRLAALLVTNALGQFAQVLLGEDTSYIRAPETACMVVRMLHAALIDSEQNMQAK
jgi:AcrR family transcriptional regulator